MNRTATEPIRKVAIYLRISRDADESTSIERQQEQCEAFVRSRPTAAADLDVDTYTDRGRSGFRADVEREEFDRMMSRIRDYDAVCVYRIDRLSRRGVKHVFDVVEKMREVGCRLLSTTEGVDTFGQTGELVLAVLASLAKMESERLSERSRAGQRSLRKLGRWTGGKTPFGYQTEELADGGTILRVDPEEAALIREVADRLLAGEGLTAIVRELNERGVPSSGRTETWSYQAMKYLLTNPTTAGYVQDDGDIYFDDDGEPVRLVQDEPVLDPAKWRRVCEVFERRKGTRPTRKGKALLAEGLVRCGECGDTMVAFRGGGRGYYRCKRKYRDGEDACPGNAVRMDAAEAFVEGAVREVLPEVLERGAEAQAEREEVEGDPIGEELARIAALRDHLNDRMDELLLDEYRDADDPDVQRTEQRLDRLAERRDELKRQRQRENGSEEAAELRELLGDEDEPYEAFLQLDTDDKRRALHLLVDHLEVWKHEGKPHGKAEVDPDRMQLVA